MYLKVPYIRVNGQLSQPSQSEVQDAVNEIAPRARLKVDMDLGHPSIEFPTHVDYSEYQRVQRELQKRGYEVS